MGRVCRQNLFLSTNRFHDGGSIDFDIGIVSSFPDIRGLPEESYRGTVNKTYMATSRLEHDFFRQTTKISFEPYWDYDMRMQWIRLTPFMIYLGGRFAFRM